MPFWNALAEVLGAVQAADLMREECTRRFPAYADPINVGYAYWSKKHAELIKRLYAIRLKRIREYGGTEADVRTRVRQYDEQLDRGRDEARAETFSGSSLSIQQTCKGLATYYGLEEMDLSKRHANEIQLILRYE